MKEYERKYNFYFARFHALHDSKCCIVPMSNTENNTQLYQRLNAWSCQDHKTAQDSTNCQNHNWKLEQACWTFNNQTRTYRWRCSTIIVLSLLHCTKHERNFLLSARLQRIWRQENSSSSSQAVNAMIRRFSKYHWKTCCWMMIFEYWFMRRYCVRNANAMRLHYKCNTWFFFIQNWTRLNILFDPSSWSSWRKKIAFESRKHFCKSKARTCKRYDCNANAMRQQCRCNTKERKGKEKKRKGKKRK